MKRRKQLRRMSALFGMLVIFTGLILPAMMPYSPTAQAEAKAQDYTQVNEQSKLSTAHSDARKAANSKSAEENAKENAENKSTDVDTSHGGSDTGSSDAGKKLDIDGAILNTIANVVRAGNFGNYGLFYGQVSSSSNDNWSAVRQGVGSNPAEAPDLDAMTNDGMTKYVQFGHSIQQMVNDNKAGSGDKVAGVIGSATVVSSPEESEVELRSLVKMFTARAKELVGRVNPLPLFRSFADNSVLSDPAMYSPQTGNFWIILVTSDPNVRSFFEMIGGDVVGPMFGIQTNGSFRISLAMMTVFVLAAFTIILGFLGSLVGVGTTSNTGWGQALRRAGVRVMVAVVGFQLFVTFGGELEKLVNGDAKISATDSSIVSNVVKRHLNLEDWYETGFALPEGVTIPIVDGKMVLTPETIQAINQFTAERMRNGKSYDELLAAPTGTASESDTKFSLLKVDNSQKAKQRAYDARSKVGDATAYAYLRIMDAAGRQSFTPTFTTQLYANYAQTTDEANNRIIGGEKAGQKWDTGILDTIAKAMSKGEKLSDKTLANVRSAEYLTNAGLQMNAVSGGYQLTMRPGYRFGISPIAAYNLMNSQFEGAKITVPDNVNSAKAPSIIYNASSTGVGKPSDNKSAVNTIVLLVLIYTAVISLFKIVGSAVGGVVKGTSAAWGSAAGLGTLFGAAITLFLGTMVLALVIEITMNLMDELWAIIDTMFRDMSLGALNDVVSGFLKGVEGIPLLGPILKWTLEGVMNSAIGIVITILMLTTMPRISTVPIKVVANYFAGLPDEFGDRARIMQEHFTGTRGYRGRDLGVGQEIGQALKSGQAGAKTFAKGAGAVAGASAAWAGAKLLDKAADKEKRELEAFKAAQAEAENPEDDNNPTDPTDTSTEAETTEETSNETTGETSGETSGDGAEGAKASSEQGEQGEQTGSEAAVGTPEGSDDTAWDDYNPDAQPTVDTELGDGPVAPSTDGTSDADGKDATAKSDAKADGTDVKADGTDTPGTTPIEKADGTDTTGTTPIEKADGTPTKPTEKDSDSSGATSSATGNPDKSDAAKAETGDTPVGAPNANPTAKADATGDKPTGTTSGDKLGGADTNIPNGRDATSTPNGPDAPKANKDAQQPTGEQPGAPKANKDAQQPTGEQPDAPNAPKANKDAQQPTGEQPQSSGTASTPSSSTQDNADDNKPTFKPSLSTRILAGTGHALHGASGGRDKGQVAAGVAMMLGSVAGGGEGGKFANDTFMRGVEQNRQDRMRSGAGDVEVNKRMRQETTVTTEQATRAQTKVEEIRNNVANAFDQRATDWWKQDQDEPRTGRQTNRQQTNDSDHKRNVEDSQRTQHARHQQDYDEYDSEYSNADDYNTDEE